MRILVTGAGGFVGSHVADFFLDRGDHVVGLDAVPWNERNYLWRRRESSKFAYFCDSILNEGLTRYLVRECDAVYHLAAAVGLKNVIGQVLNVIEINVRGTEIVLRLAAEHGKRVLFTSTSEIAGKSPNVPFGEADDRVLGPTSVDRWVYSETKALGEYICLGYHRVGLPISIVRLFNVYGPRLDREGSGRVITRFMRQMMNEEPITIIGDGTQTRSYTYVTDIVRGIVAAGERPEAIGRTVNLGSTVEVSVNHLVEVLGRVMGCTPTTRYVRLDEVYGAGYEDIPRRVPNIEMASRLLDFKATVPLEEGLRQTARWLSTCDQIAGA